VWTTLFSRVTPARRDRIYEVLKIIALEDKRIGSRRAQPRPEAMAGNRHVAGLEPKLLLVDEPAAGMTDEETRKTGELLLSLEGKHSIVVIEHDMTLCGRSPAK